MLGQIIWWLGAALEALLLVRGVRGKWMSRYRFFYAYIVFVLSQSLLRYAVYHWNQQFYPHVYWLTQLLAVLIGCGVTFEIYRIGLSAYPGTARMARNLLGIVFVLAGTKAFVAASNDPRWWPIATTTDIELALRTVQAVSIGALVVLFLFYNVPFGRNLRGITFGYGLFVTMNSVRLAFEMLQGKPLAGFWSHAESFVYALVLGVWATHLWSYETQPEPEAAVPLEQEYQRVATATRQRLQEARGYIGKVMGS